MKTALTLLLGLFVALLFSNVSTYAQRGNGVGKGNGVQREGGSAARINRQIGIDQKRAEHDREHSANEARKEERVFEDLERNPALAEQVRAILPAGTNLKDASAGFKNQGQFMAALNVSKNLNIPFNQLRSKMTGEHPMSLGQVIHELRPNLTEKNAQDEAKRAEKEAKSTKNP